MGLSVHPALRRVTVETPAGPLDMAAPPVRYKDMDVAAPRPVPAVGEHTEAIRAEFGGEDTARDGG